jgi:hypothetical protein
MKSSRSYPYRSSLLITGLLLLTQIACVLSNPTPAVWSLTPSAQARSAKGTALAKTQAADVEPLPTFTVTPSLAPSTPTPHTTDLLETGPWLVYPSDGGKSLVALNPDGSSLTRIPLPPLIDFNDLGAAISPQGGMVALRTGQRSSYADLQLVILHLPTGAIETITPLLSPYMQNLVSGGEGSDRPRLAAQAVCGRNALSWSPNERYLAFIGAIDGDSSDLYAYDTFQHQTIRLTSGSNQAATPFWSPDSQWVITQEFTGYTPAGNLRLTNVWAANISSREIIKLYAPPTDSSTETFLGWSGAEQMLSYSRNLQGGYDLRQVDVIRATVQSILPGPFSELAYDPASKSMAFIVSGVGVANGIENTKINLSAGLYLMPPESEPRLVETGDLRNLRWSVQNSVFYASSSLGVPRIGPDGSTARVYNEANALLSPSGSWLAGWGHAPEDPRPGVRLYQANGDLLQSVSNDSIQDLAWQPGSNGFFYLAGSRLYLVNFPQLQPILLDENIQPGQKVGLVWFPGLSR